MWAVPRVYMACRHPRPPAVHTCSKMLQLVLLAGQRRHLGSVVAALPQNCWLNCGHWMWLSCHIDPSRQLGCIMQASESRWGSQARMEKKMAWRRRSNTFSDDV